MERKLKLIKPAAGSYAAWEASIEKSVESECTKLRKKRAAKRTPESESLELDLAKMRRKRLYSILSDASRLLILADDIALASLPSNSEGSKKLRILIASMRNGSFTAENLFRRLPMSEFVKTGE